MVDKADDSRYAHLLQPIRELSGNWNINIADELEEYLVSLWTEPPSLMSFISIFCCAEIYPRWMVTG